MSPLLEGITKGLLFCVLAHQIEAKAPFLATPS